jgi:hypothetical protein
MLFLSLASLQVHAQAEDTFSNLEASHIFGESITFTGQLKTSNEIETVTVTFRPIATGRSVLAPAAYTDGTLSAEYPLQPQDYIPPFGLIEFWFSATLINGEELRSSTQTYQYADNRFTWQTLTYQNSYNVYWSEGDQSFGQAVLDAVLGSNSNMSTFLELPIPDQLSIYVYPTNSALQSALEITNARWVAGHADPANNVVLVSIPASFDQQLAIQRVIPHEITHIRLYLYLEENYQNLPAWLSEGLASLSEQYTLSEYWQILQAAQRDGQLIPIEDLCTNFPVDSDNASLAYAQSDSFTRYIYKEFGKIGLQSLVDTYALGHPCKNGVSIALQVDLQELEKAWYQDTFKASFLPDTASSALAWILLLLIVVLSPIGLLVLTKRR